MAGAGSGSDDGEGNAVARKFREQEEAMRRLNEKLELRRQELSRRTQVIETSCAELESDIDVDETMSQHNLSVVEGDTFSDDGIDIMSSDERGERIDPSTSNLNHLLDETSVDGDLQQLTLEEDVLGSVGMAPESRERLLKARLKVTKNELERVKQQLAESSKELEASRSTVKQLQEELKKQRRRAAHAEAKCQKLEQAQHSVNDDANELRRQHEQLQADMQTAKKMVKQLENQVKAKESKMNRALADAHRNKEQLSSHESSIKASAAAWRSEKAQLEQENKKLSKHKVELLNIVRKQMTLVDIVQRQKAHMEAARLLTFTEQQFSEQLDGRAPPLPPS